MKEFWITNISKMNVTLADLGLSIKKYSSLNLLDQKHFKYTLEQLEKSASSGSLFVKSNIIKIRHKAPGKTIKSLIDVNKEAKPLKPLRTLVKMEEKEYEELLISDEKFAEQFSIIEENNKK